MRFAYSENFFFLGLKGQDDLVCSPPTEKHEREHVIVFANGYVSTSSFFVFHHSINLNVLDEMF